MEVLCYGDKLKMFDLYALPSKTGKCLYRGHQQQHTHINFTIVKNCAH